MLRSCGLLLLWLLVPGGIAWGQTGANISAGVDYGADVPVSDRLERRRAWGVAFRLPRPEAWSVAWDFGSVESTLSHLVAGSETSIGTLRLRPVLAGAAYTWTRGRVEATALVTGGVAFVSVDLDEAGRRRLVSAFRTQDVRADSKATFTIQPKLTLLFDVNRWIGLTTSAGYLSLRPRVTLSADGATLEQFRIDADAVRVSAGVVVKVF
jgi:hypothetical protein